MKLGKQFALAALVMTAAMPALAQVRSGSINPSLQLLSLPEVRQELKLTEAQASELATLQGNLRQGTFDLLSSFKDLPAAERAKKFTAFREGFDRKVVEILTPDQRKRLHQLELQRSGVRALLKRDVQVELGVTREQTAKLAGLLREESTTLRGLYQGGNGENPEAQEAARRKMSTLQAETNDAFLGVLTEDQKREFQKMQGLPFRFPERKPRAVTVSNPGPAGEVAPKPAGEVAPKPAALKPAVAKPAVAKPAPKPGAKPAPKAAPKRVSKPAAKPAPKK